MSSVLKKADKLNLSLIWYNENLIFVFNFFLRMLQIHCEYIDFQLFVGNCPEREGGGGGGTSPTCFPACCLSALQRAKLG